MNKAELKKFAVEARRELIEKVSLKAEQYGITKEYQTLLFEEKYGELLVNGRTYPTSLKNALKAIESKLKKVGYEQLIEEVSYTWFNRITAIRYMEVNGHLPERVNVLSSTMGKSEPDIIFDHETMDLDIEIDEIRSLLKEEQTEFAYRKLFVAQCNALNKIMPFLFEQIEDYTELLLPDYLLDQQSIIRKITEEVSERNFYEIEENGSKKDNVEILGWLYQYYMSEKKEEVGGLKNKSVRKEDLPVVTQLFTPKWIVQYMVQNSLGKLYDEKYENNNLSKHWQYYLKHEENHHLYPEFDSLEEMKIMDPACGSGHILLYAFDILYDMYQEAGYPSRNIPELILANNLYGLDIDKRAQQIANFALLMKAVEKQPRLLARLNRKKEPIKINVYEIVDADQSLSEEALNYFTKCDTQKRKVRETMSQFKNAKQYGSLIFPIDQPYFEWEKRITKLIKNPRDLFEDTYSKELSEKLLDITKQASLLREHYDIVITNPPYHSKYNNDLKKFIVENYNDYKMDLYSAFIVRATKMLKFNGYSSLMTPYTWMFISSHKTLRSYLLKNTTISSLVQLEYSAFEEATVPICTFTIQNQSRYTLGEYIRLADYKGADIQPFKLQEAAINSNICYRYHKYSDSFEKLPNNPVAYWASEKILKLFKEDETIKDYLSGGNGMTTGANNKFLRLWHEVSISKTKFNAQDENEAYLSNAKWFPYIKGGAYRKWYGNLEYVIDWHKNGENIKNYDKCFLRNKNYYFKEGISWSKISSGSFSVRYSPQGALFDVAGISLFNNSSRSTEEFLGFLNSKVANHLLKYLSPTLNYEAGTIKSLPLIANDENIEKIVNDQISISKKDWDFYETSWDFIRNPFVTYNTDSIEYAFESWQEELFSLRNRYKINEEKINKMFIQLYNLEDELLPEISEKEVVISRADQEKDAKHFLSYFIGCIVGRYSINSEGLAYAGGAFNENKYSIFNPNKGGLIHITENKYFENDIIVRLKEFLAVTFSGDTIDENINWLGESLTMRKNESSEERLRRYFMDDFFKDHCKTYQKRPIYWLVDSGKQKGLRTLIYMHRYQPDTMATIRFEHLQEIQSKYQNEIEVLEIRLSNPDISASDRKNLEKSKESYQKKIEELQEFDKKLAVYANEPIDIDLDDGVKVNYAKFDDVLAKIK
ncbi:BREX-1 system adenine-specific DNA-methyltransferase PglX [Lacicoccus qingdaonensis]|uniref:site-specific DNA-methyltransferase (adenine-specific) n=1 Tax=Lacicoccus qingdaonensis TaxID=576118 RepID=A0A1G9AYZ7_9BACL|nr:BREX-1 system adenine-specific DNA-methyltransferase PglX [Salinicoccus qingdaonensis]SDK32559.1 Eco57I restriction-modification methylase [Salinicoccus qingdaonensis]